MRDELFERVQAEFADNLERFNSKDDWKDKWLAINADLAVKGVGMKFVDYLHTDHLPFLTGDTL
jgi:hypothetical protein